MSFVHSAFYGQYMYYYSVLKNPLGRTNRIIYTLVWVKIVCLVRPYHFLEPIQESMIIVSYFLINFQNSSLQSYLFSDSPYQKDSGTYLHPIQLSIHCP